MSRAERQRRDVDPPGPGRAAEPLAEYRRKRAFERTPEPAPDAVDPERSGFSYLIQKHAARRLHYDLRLELDGVLKSWAVTRGPSLDPEVRRLAVHVEDHPLEYGQFEGVIPKGEYGGGTVMLWDRGHWEPLEDPRRSYPRGKLAFRLHGARLKGAWKLVRMGGRGEDGRNWLLFKVADEEARPGEGDALLDSEETSVVSSRTMAEIAAAADRVWRSDRGGAEDVGSPARQRPALSPEVRELGVPTAAMPDFVAPQLAFLAEKPPRGEGWLHEIKFDGYRIQCRIERGRVALRTRTGLDWTARFPRLAADAARLPVEHAILDGELVAMLPSGVSSFALLQDVLKGGQSDSLVYWAFDLLFLDGRDLRGVPLEQRKAALAAVVGDEGAGVLRYSDHHVASGPEFFGSACRMALEGVVSKRRAAPYGSGRGRDWVKAKCIERQEFVVGGFTRPSTGVHGVGALLLGYFRDGALVYVGRVGTGFGEAVSRDLRQRLQPLATAKPPFLDVPAASRRGVTWVEPKLVCEVEFRTWTGDGRLRHASFQGLREDKPAETVSLETSSPTTPAGAGDAAAIVEEFRLTHPDRVLFPQLGLTKRGLAEYYAEIAPWILPHVAGRPLSLVRCPSGQDKSCFYQKHIREALPAGLRQVSIRERDGEKPYTVVDDLAGLLALVQMSVLEIHPWGSREDDVEHPDRIVFDFDPDPAVPWPAVVAAAREMRTRLSDEGLRSFVKTTGGKGLHVVVPVDPVRPWPEVSAFAARIARTMARAQPERFTDRLAKAARPNRIFIDYLHNSRGATAVAAYSPRARPNATVATPLDWDELGPEIASDHFTVASVLRRLAGLDRDPWGEMPSVRQTIADEQVETKRRRRD